MKSEKRQTVFNMLRTQYISEGYISKEYTLSIFKANLISFVITLPIIIICCAIYLNVHNLSEVYIKWKDLIFIIFLMIAFFFIHELIHGITWKYFCKDKKNISYGIMLKQLTPYCCCSEALNFNGYILGILMPFIIIGMGGFIIALILSNDMLLILSLLNITTASGDLTIALMLLNHRNSIIIDHPTKCGFVAFNK